MKFHNVTSHTCLTTVTNDPNTLTEPAQQARAVCNLETDSDPDSDEAGAIVAIASSSKLHLTIYDTGTLHHFVPCESLFRDLTTRPKPIRFYQAVGSTSLTKQGTARIRIGGVLLDLRKFLYSPHSSFIILSTGRLQKHGAIVPDKNLTQPIRKDPRNQHIPTARLVQKNNVYIEPFSDHGHTPSHITAPGIARVPKTTSAQRWHQRHDHNGQKLLKKTAQYSKGMEGLDTGELTICETCHLSKAQQFVSREPRPTPFEPLDEVFIDTVGKLTTACYGHQYAVIITDAKSRMRWAISIRTKDQIPPQLVKWVEHQYHQFGKRVHTIFKDEGLEISRIKTYCNQHGTSTNVSAPYTPE
ncbi:hypothetical protein K3495_g12213 [Podosphaera aphanis]|nr:hypothetical protein K3495_g12213 [Podosphaera aphanis]